MFLVRGVSHRHGRNLSHYPNIILKVNYINVIETKTVTARHNIRARSTNTLLDVPSSTSDVTRATAPRRSLLLFNKRSETQITEYSLLAIKDICLLAISSLL